MSKPKKSQKITIKKMCEDLNIHVNTGTNWGVAKLTKEHQKFTMKKEVEDKVLKDKEYLDSIKTKLLKAIDDGLTNTEGAEKGLNDMEKSQFKLKLLDILAKASKGEKD